ncbi:MAG: hypothetical protein AB7S71_23735 [Dongiaceae bacterium]
MELACLAKCFSVRAMKEELFMRLAMVLLTAAVALGGCVASGPQRVDASGPTVSYRVDSQREFDQAAERADEWCYENYRARARLADAGGDYNRNVVTFECE